jgi:hypothetical protein
MLYMTKAHYLLLMLMLAGCSSAIKVNYYEPAVYKADISYQPKPMSADSFKSATYISGGYNQKQTSSEESADIAHMFQLFLSRAHTFSNLNISYGASGLAGYLKNNMMEAKDPFYFKRKPFSSLALNGSINTYVNKNNVDYRLLGAEFSYSREFGAFKDFRNEIYHQPNFYSVTNRELFTAGLSSEIIFHLEDDVSTQFGFRLFAGKTLTRMNYQGQSDVGVIPKELNPYTATFAFFFQKGPFNTVLEAGTSSQLRFGYRF